MVLGCWLCGVRFSGALVSPLSVLASTPFHVGHGRLGIHLVRVLYVALLFAEVYTGAPFVGTEVVMANKKKSKRPTPNKSKPKERKFPAAKKGDWIRPDKASVHQP